MEIEISKSIRFNGKDMPDTEDYELTVKGSDQNLVADTYIQLRKKLDEILKETFYLGW